MELASDHPHPTGEETTAALFILDALDALDPLTDEALHGAAADLTWESLGAGPVRRYVSLAAQRGRRRSEVLRALVG